MALSLPAEQTHKEMNRSDQTTFVSEQARNVTRQLSGWNTFDSRVVWKKQSLSTITRRESTHGGDRL